jgi:hypothetical protein
MSEQDRMRDDLIHQLRLKGWSRIEAESEAEDRAEARRLKVQSTREQEGK